MTGLVAKGYNQTLGIAYNETFRSIVELATNHLVLSLTVSFSGSIKQLDIHYAFLNGDLFQTNYLRQLPRIKEPIYPNHVCQLKMRFMA